MRLLDYETFCKVLNVSYTRVTEACKPKDRKDLITRMKEISISEFGVKLIDSTTTSWMDGYVEDEIKFVSFLLKYVGV